MRDDKHNGIATLQHHCILCLEPSGMSSATMTVAGIGMKKFSRDKNIDCGNSRLNKVNNMPLGAFKVVLISYLFLTYWVTYWVTYLIRRTRRRVISNEIKDNALDCPLFLFAYLFVTYRTAYSENQTLIGLPFLSVSSPHLSPSSPLWVHFSTWGSVTSHLYPIFYLLDFCTGPMCEPPPCCGDVICHPGEL